ncbi:MAG: CRISPR-associated endoribonuclease Cas6 [Aquificaceae bacterium]
MRLKVLLKAHKIPIFYRNIIMSLIKEALSTYDEKYLNQLYYDEKTKKPKPFTFSLVFPKGTKTKKEKILIENQEIEDIVFYPPHDKYINLFISSYDFEFISNLYNGLLKLRRFSLSNGGHIEIERIWTPKEKDIKDNKIIFKTLSPILIEDKDGKPLLPTDLEAYNREFNIIHDKKLKELRSQGLKDSLLFEPIKWKKQVVKHTLRKIREKVGKPYITLTCFEGYFTLQGHPEDLKILYQAGMGLRTGQGFGMVEVV